MNSIYIHIPFCDRKCFYCDFYSIENSSYIDSYIDSLKKEIDLCSEKKYFSEIQTIYFGGGTPSKIPAVRIEEILNQINKYFTLNTKAEISIEVNPGSITKTSLKQYKEFGINRLSIGIQSFIQKELNFLERIHTVGEAQEAILSARESGFSNISIDLIYAIPNSSVENWKYNLKTALKFEPSHISAYSLIFEEGTRLFDEMKQNRIISVSEENEAEMYEFTMGFLQKNGYNHYEVSNYAIPGFECNHNKNYWNFSNYLGLGPSAHSYIDKKRWWNFRDIKKYISLLDENLLPVDSYEHITDEMALREMIFLGLRSAGIDLVKIKNEFNIDFYQKNRNIIENLLSGGYIELKDQQITLTDNGFLVCDEICKKLI
jgi:oxygen-independent coproporphyrinogen-3 oxidase